MTSQSREEGMSVEQHRLSSLWSRVGKSNPNECWPWLGHITDQGYGHFRGRAAHRVLYEIVVGAVPDGLVLDHLCRVRHCVNPGHLEPVTNRENVLRGVGPAAKKSQQTHCIRGHILDEANTYITPKGGRRNCRTCHSANTTAQRARLVAKGLSTRGEPRSPRSRFIEKVAA